MDRICSTNQRLSAVTFLPRTRCRDKAVAFLSPDRLPSRKHDRGRTGEFEVIHRSEGQGDQFPEPLFAVLNFAKINSSPMTVETWTMEVDWVKHERRVE